MMMKKTEIDNKQIQIDYYEKLKEGYEVRLYYLSDKKRFKDEYEENEMEILKLKTIHSLQMIKAKIEFLYLEFHTLFDQMIEKQLILELHKES